MKRLRKIALDFEVAKLTNSIQNVVTVDSFATEISVVTLYDLKSIIKKNKKDTMGIFPSFQNTTGPTLHSQFSNNACWRQNYDYRHKRSIKIN